MGNSPLNVLAVNSSPHREKGGTGLMLAPFLDGMKHAGARVELRCLHGADIRPCRGCLACWFGTPGRCVQRDAMDRLLPMVARSDVLVLATPLYVDGMNGTMKTFLDRCLPLLDPFFVVRGRRCRHARVAGFRPGRVALVSACGFTEVANFRPLVAHVRAVAANMGRDYAGALLRPYAGSLDHLARAGVATDGVFAAAEAAGRELVRRGRVSPALERLVSRPLITRARYVRAINVSFRRRLRRPGLD